MKTPYERTYREACDDAIVNWLIVQVIDGGRHIADLEGYQGEVIEGLHLRHSGLDYGTYQIADALMVEERHIAETKSAIDQWRSRKWITS